MNSIASRVFASLATLMVVVAMELVVALLAGRCSADDGVLGPSLATIRLPDVGARVLGFKTQIQIARESSAGYVPVKISFNAIGTLPADRRMIYRFETSLDGQTPPRNGLTIDIPISLQQGTTSETFVRYLPKWSAGQAIELSIIEDGRVLEDYTAIVGGQVRRGRRANRSLLSNEHKINWVFLSSTDEVPQTKIRDLGGIFSSLISRPLSEEESASVLSQAASGPQLLSIGQKNLPGDWRGYQRYDVVAMDTQGLTRLQTSDQRFQAVRGWILNGGTVIVYDAQSPESVLSSFNFRWTGDTEAAGRIQSIAKSLISIGADREQRLKEQIAQLQDRVDRYTAAAAKSSLTDGSQSPADLAGMEGLYSINNGDAKEELKQAQTRLEQSAMIPQYSASQWSKQVWMQPAGAGMVIGIQKSDQYAMPPPMHWQIATTTIDYRASPMLRRGVDPLVGDRRFARWMIPGVAQPPVYTFMGLLTAFVILVGPVAYRRTAKHGRSYLMFAIAPALALVTTLAMFGYGIMSDGFGIVVRARQLTWVDGRSGDAGERIRTTYFAGVRPGEGLRFPGDAEVIGYPEGVGKSWEDLNELSPATIGKVLIRDDSQLFDSSFLPSRQQRQFVVHAPRNDIGYLKLIPDANAIMPPNVENGFDFLLHKAAIRDSRGVYWFIENLAAGASSSCKPLSLKDSSKMLGEIYNEHRPLSVVREARRRSVYDKEMYDVIVDTNRELSTKTTVDEGAFEYWLQFHLQTTNEIPRDNFVATADVSRDVLAVKGSELVESVRYVFGTLR